VAQPHKGPPFRTCKQPALSIPTAVKDNVNFKARELVEIVLKLAEVAEV
jgi:hypothetical protein